jgi:hypothetical protein
MYLQFQWTIEHRPKSDKGSFTTGLPVHSREDSVTSTYVIVSLIVVAVFQLYKTFSPLFLFTDDLKSSHRLSISPGLMDRLQT